ncbi:NAD(P)/FAD-dependent oxidoreductase [Aquimarina pacifica]|uniref:NAD(P)/FAD-dependent oxidoreductase n=1 Tax=Aquimarina pacifica TaxID=1296415 RepID=UPI00046EC83B|nr:FAD-dependent oxidoreductase [Aquimarina pacifica]
MLDYFVVGLGLAGMSFVEELEKNGKSFVVYENYSQKSSRVAGGLYNPVILKRFTAAWKALEQVENAFSFYKNIEKKLNISILIEVPVLRRFNAVEEQNTWFEAADKPILTDLLSTELIPNKNQALDIPYQYGKVKNTGRIDTEKLLTSYINYLKDKDSILNESFNYDSLVIQKDYVEYKGQRARNIIFTEGYGVVNNTFFNYLPIHGNKGEYIIIKCDKLKLSEAVKSSVFIIPLGNDYYKVGATYNNKDKTSAITDEAKKELQEKLERFLRAEYTVEDQVAGIRPTTKDRKPMVGSHPEHQNIHILNGLGSRGILIGPYVAKKLYDYIEYQKPLDGEINISRFKNLR